MSRDVNDVVRSDSCKTKDSCVDRLFSSAKRDGLTYVVAPTASVAADAQPEARFGRRGKAARFVVSLECCMLHIFWCLYM